MRYYDDEGKITYDEAAQFVELYIAECAGKHQSTVSAGQVAESFDVEPTQHNLVRITTELGERCEIERRAQSTLYRL